ncbi:MFS transporter [Bacillus mycoides]
MKWFNEYKKLFKHKGFFTLLLGAFFSNIGHSVAVISIIWMIYQKTNDPFTIVLTLICLEVPTIIFGPILGVLLDRYKTSTLMGIANIFRSILFVFLIFIPLQDSVTYSLFFVLLSISSAVIPITRSGEYILISKIIPKENLISANSIMNIQFDLAFTLGPMLAGGLMFISLGNNIFIVNAIVLFFSSILFFLIKVKDSGKEYTNHQIKAKKISFKTKEWWQEFSEGIKFITSNKTILYLVFINFLWNFLIWGTGPTLSPVYARDYINIGAEGYGMLAATSSIGIIVGSFLVGLKKINYSPTTIVFISIALHSLLYSLLATQNHLIGAIIVSVLGGIMSAPAMIYHRTALQTIVPEEKMGRIFTVSSTAGAAGFPIGNFLAAYSIQILGKQSMIWAFVISGGIVLLLSILLLISINRKGGNYESNITSIDD